MGKSTHLTKFSCTDVFQPLLELVHFLKTNQFKEFIVSVGGVDCMREELSSVYDILKDQIIGSSLIYSLLM